MSNLYSLGLYYGYPKCCIESFIRDKNSMGWLFRGERQLTGTGYIPCAECNARYTPNEMVKRINANRGCPKRFPVSGISGVTGVNDD